MEIARSLSVPMNSTAPPGSLVDIIQAHPSVRAAPCLRPLVDIIQARKRVRPQVPINDQKKICIYTWPYLRIKTLERKMLPANTKKFIARKMKK
jgi:hypothetical protein